MKVNWYDAPLAMESEVNKTGYPESEAIACVTLSWFVHVTTDPVLTVSIAGLNAKFLIVIVFATAVGTGVTGVVAVGAAGLWYDEQPADRQARTSTTAHAQKNTKRDCVAIIP
jgi:hypothetical protein